MSSNSAIDPTWSNTAAVAPAILPSRANLLAPSKFIFLPVKACSSNCADMDFSKSNRPSDTLAMVDKLTPILAASIAAFLRAFTFPPKYFEVALEFSAMSAVTAPTLTPAFIASAAKSLCVLAASSAVAPIRINALLTLPACSAPYPNAIPISETAPACLADIIPITPNSFTVSVMTAKMSFCNES